jgi:inositol transporter-like SP family MFS transporter
MRALLSGPVLRALLFTGIFYTFWNAAAGTYGFFLPYLMRAVGSESQAASVALQSLWFIVTLLFCVFIFMPHGDGPHRRLICTVGAVAQVVAFLLFIVFPVTLPVAIANIALFGIGAALAGEPFYRVWSQELFPTLLRGTAQGITFCVARIVVGVWSFFVPVLAAASGFKGIAVVLMIMLLISGFVGTVFMPNTAGKSLEQIQEERAGGLVRSASTMEKEKSSV